MKLLFGIGFILAAGCAATPDSAGFDIVHDTADVRGDLDTEPDTFADAADAKPVWKNGLQSCTATDQECAGICHGEGACHCVNGWCVPLADADCAESWICLYQGYCHVVQSWCRPTSQEDCTSGKLCGPNPTPGYYCHYCDFNCCNVSEASANPQKYGCWPPRDVPLYKPYGPCLP